MMNIILKTEMNWKSRKSAYRGLVLWPVWRSCLYRNMMIIMKSFSRRTLKRPIDCLDHQPFHSKPRLVTRRKAWHSAFSEAPEPHFLGDIHHEHLLSLSLRRSSRNAHLSRRTGC